MCTGCHGVIWHQPDGAAIVRDGRVGIVGRLVEFRPPDKPIRVGEPDGFGIILNGLVIVSETKLHSHAHRKRLVQLHTEACLDAEAADNADRANAIAQAGI